MDVREHYAMDLPRGVRLVGGGWDGMTVRDVRWLDRRRREPLVELTLIGDGHGGYSSAVVTCDPHGRLSADHDAPDRLARLERARALVQPDARAARA